MALRLSKFGKSLSGETGVSSLMLDIGEAIDKARTSDQPFHALGGGNPASIPEVEAIFSQLLSDIANDPDDLRSIVGSYDSPQGDTEFIAATAALLRNHCGWNLSAENIMLTNGSQSAFFMLFNTLAGLHEDGSFKHILLPLTPEYIGYNDVGIDASVFKSNRPRIDLLGEHQFKYAIDFESLVINEDTAAICLSRPTNPTGNVVTDSELAKLQTLARNADIPLIVDAAYGSPFPGLVYTDTTPVWDENCIVCLSLSKVGLPGVRTGIVIARPELIAALTSMNAIMNLCTGSFGPGLARKLISNGEILHVSKKYVQPFYRQRMQKAVNWLEHYLGDLPWRVHKPEGAFFLWLWFPDLPIDSQTLYRRLKDRGVLVIAGHYFFAGISDPDWKHCHECIRITYSQQADAVERGIEIIANTVKEAYDDTA